MTVVTMLARTFNLDTCINCLIKGAICSSSVLARDRQAHGTQDGDGEDEGIHLRLDVGGFHVVQAR